MTWLDDIGTYLQTNGIGTLGTDIFYKVFDPTAQNCIALIDQPGRSPKTTLRNTMILKKPELGVRIQNQDDTTASAKADSIYDLLNEIHNKTIGSTRFKSIKAISEPFFVSQTPNNSFRYSINFALEIG